MIDFRYHLVSIVAIFLALAIGIVLGTTALNGPVTEALQKGNDSLNADLKASRAMSQGAEGRLNDIRSLSGTRSERLRVILTQGHGCP